jgi:hypothetical protein
LRAARVRPFAALPIAALAANEVAPGLKIEPDHGVARAMPLRHVLLGEKGQRLSRHAAVADRDGQRRDKRCHSQEPKVPQVPQVRHQCPV